MILLNLPIHCCAVARMLSITCISSATEVKNLRQNDENFGLMNDEFFIRKPPPLLEKKTR